VGLEWEGAAIVGKGMIFGGAVAIPTSQSFGAETQGGDSTAEPSTPHTPQQTNAQPLLHPTFCPPAPPHFAISRLTSRSICHLLYCINSRLAP